MSLGQFATFIHLSLGHSGSSRMVDADLVSSRPSFSPSHKNQTIGSPLRFELLPARRRKEAVEKLVSYRSVLLVAIPDCSSSDIPLSRIHPIMPIMRELSEEDDVILGKPGGLATNARYMSAIEQWGPHYANAMKADKKPILHQVYSHLVGSGLRFFVKGGGPDPGGNLVYEPADEARATASIQMSLQNHIKHPSQLGTRVSSMAADANKGKSVAGTLEDGGSVGGGGELSHGMTDGGRRLVTGNEAQAGAPLPGLAEVNLLPQMSGDRPMAEVEANKAERKKKRDAEAAAPTHAAEPETHRRRTGSAAVGAVSPDPPSPNEPKVAHRDVGVDTSDLGSHAAAAPVPGPRVATLGRRVEGMSQEGGEDDDDDDDGARAAIEGQFQRAVPDGECRALRTQGVAAHDAERRALRAQVAAAQDAERRALLAMIRAKDDELRAAQRELRALRGLLSTLWGGEETHEAPSG
jgi:hypothetical protein